MAKSTMQVAGAEFLGTLTLVLVGCGAAVIGAGESSIDLLGVALAFGLAVMMMAYAVGPISGGHFNPAVTLGQAFAGKLSWGQVPTYWVAQVLGGIVGAAILYAIVVYGTGYDVASGFASNGYGAASPKGYSMIAGAITEIVVTYIFVTVILSFGKKDAPGHMAGLVIGLTLAALIVLSGNVTNASLNPARSLATAVFEGGIYLQQAWFFWVTPLIGGALAGLGHSCLHGCNSCCKDEICTIEA